MRVPHNRWTDGGWNKKLPVLRPLARWFGIDSSNPTMDELQVPYQAVAPKVFHQSVPKVLEATDMNEGTLRRRMSEVWYRLGLGGPIPPRSLKLGRCNPVDLSGAVAFVLGGTVSWMRLRLDRTLLTQHAGADFERIIVLGSSRVCNASADLRHPYIRKVYPEGEYPTERTLLRQWIYANGKIDRQYIFPDLPDEGPPLSLEQQLKYLVESGQYAELVGERKVFVAVNGGNALYIPLHMRRVLGLDDIWFSQPASDVVTPVPDYWWPEDQDLLTTPSGIIRLWIELRANGCINDEVK